MYEQFSFADNFVKLTEFYLLFGLSLPAAICAAEADVTALVFSADGPDAASSSQHSAPCHPLSGNRPFTPLKSRPATERIQSEIPAIDYWMRRWS